MKNLEFNKIAASVLLAGIIAMAAGKIAQIAYHGGLEHPGGPTTEAKRGYSIEGVDLAAGSETSAPKVEVIPDILPLLAAANIEAGKDYTKKCVSCHSFEKDGANKIGPNLWGAVGGNKGHRAEGYAYSKTLSGMTGTWGYEQIAHFLYAPQKYAPGTKMSYAGIKKPEDLANIIGYMRTLSDSPLALPAGGK